MRVLLTKHEQILQHILGLDVGSKISVRQVAKDLNVSEGTAYRAIKEAENQGIVSTIERVGTIRIERQAKSNIEKLTFAEVVNIVEGQVLGGRAGLHKTLHKFVIGAMKLEAMMRYVDAGSLLIVGNRVNAHELGLKAGSAILITGGFDTEEEVKRLADELQLPVISTSYDTFTVATMINKAIHDRLIKKEIVLASDILIPIEDTHYLFQTDEVKRWHELNQETNHSRYPVVDQTNRVTGIVTSKDIIGIPETTQVEKVMTRSPLTVTEKTSVAACAHMMIWEGIELLPVTGASHKLIGILTRQDVLKAMQMMQKQPQVGATIDDLISTELKEHKYDNQMSFSCLITPQMTNHLGTVSYGVLMTLVTEVARKTLRRIKKGDLVVENVTFYYIKPVQIESEIEFIPRVLEVSRKFGKIEVEIFHEGKIVGKAMMMAQLIDHRS
ncbi:putative transcriptional regulator [Fictibacillus barbaricus]|uniref:Transcriptional regulator n=1 Tax=Fictibacillus barbaricus TaxID=182136 RepID=A0ABU1U318_9BACL|nr:putative transcriptional regulator [Fictibacillus barbaricus]